MGPRNFLAANRKTGMKDYTTTTTQVACEEKQPIFLTCKKCFIFIKLVWYDIAPPHYQWPNGSLACLSSSWCAQRSVSATILSHTLLILNSRKGWECKCSKADYILRFLPLWMIFMWYCIFCLLSYFCVTCSYPFRKQLWLVFSVVHNHPITLTSARLEQEQLC